MKSIIKIFQSKFLLCMLMSLMIISSYASATTLSVTRYQQERTHWCWAASPQMVGKYITGTKKSQSAIVKKVKGSVVNESGDLDDIMKAIAYTTKKTGYLEATIPYTVAQGYIQNHEPFIVRIRWESNKNSGHALVCSGYRTKNGEQQLYLIDPWLKCKESYKKKYYSYTKLKNSSQFSSGKARWTNTVTYF